VPERLRETDRREAVIREYEDDRSTAIAVDFGPDAGDVTVDIVDDTAIVVVGDEHFEFELPDDVDELSTNNGVLTITE
ncbi:MAG TPA: hypothetical protein VFJ06_09900, partial [Halococcus sp.]|nr:hypothetical protein [Halococcus sp.]